MRRRARVDSNQTVIVEALRKAGAKVAHTAQLGKGFPDLLVAFRGNWFLMEVKDGRLKPSLQKLTPDEQEWHAHFSQQAPVHVVRNVDEAMRVLRVVI